MKKRQDKGEKGDKRREKRLQVKKRQERGEKENER